MGEVSACVVYPLSAAVSTRLHSPGLLKKKSDRKQPIKVSSAEVANVCISCQLYQTAKRVLVQIHTEILTGESVCLSHSTTPSPLCM